MSDSRTLNCATKLQRVVCNRGYAEKEENRTLGEMVEGSR